MRPGSRLLDASISAAISFFCFLLYNATLTPSLSYSSPDGNELTTVAATLGLAHPTGYPLYTWLGFLFSHLLPFGDAAHRTNLMSAILGAGGVGILYLIARRIELARPIAVFTALLFGATTTFWSQAVITEVYAPNVFMLALTVWLLLTWASRVERGDHGRAKEVWFILFALSFGLSLGTHMSNLGFAPAYAAFVLLTDWRILKRPLTIVAALSVFLLGIGQFLWLPLRAATVNDPLILRFPPGTVAGIYAYTLGAFSNLRFAFPITAQPDRVVVYLGYLVQNFTFVGVAIGLLGMWALLFHHPRRFWLFAGMYFVNVLFFTQYKVFDLDVFFIPSHFVFALFVGCGALQLFEWLRALVARRRVPARIAASAGAAALIIFFYVPALGLAASSFRANNKTTDTAIPDFYRNVYSMLPQGSTLVGRRGVFGYDMYYWKKVDNMRPDVTVPLFDKARPLPGAPLFTTVRLVNGEPQGGAWAPPRQMLSQDAWYVPTLVGRERDLVLYRASATPPDMTIKQAQPRVRLNREFDGIVLIGYDLDDVAGAPTPRIHLKAYWRVAQPRAYLVSTQVDNIALETHDLGFGNLPRYVQQVRPRPDGILVEEYDVVLPSYLKPGTHAFRIGLAQFDADGIVMEWADAGTVLVQ